MDAAKRIAESSYTNRDASDSPRTHEDNVSAGTKEIVRRSKKPKMTTLTEEASSSRIKWSKEEEIIILMAIIDFQNERKVNYRCDYDALYGYVKEDIKEAEFTKKQLLDKIEHLRKRFLIIQTRSNTDDGHDELFNLSMTIWGRNETVQVAPTENSNQPKDVPYVEHENRDVPIAQQEGVTIVIENADKEEEGIDELHVLQEIIEAQSSFKTLGRFQKKVLLENLGKLEADNQKELINEWNTLVIQELQLDVKKKSFSAKLANGGIIPF